ncbi:Site-specific recombinase [Prochlorococcus marinus str. MIT 9215]|uniref:Site-specific recombinase n=1 Tax=Prochlorococcus marinus (strain MIT 9215) TaxID=93060 RepID=A8G715_PROM2|nr:recombinase family protein [Prochlorococcus marinus]ABV51396.1 Site-specific recombinase [Prochlorococcus marinus str. MIT 9215]
MQVFDTVKNISLNTLSFQFKRKKNLLTENKKKKSIGYARATDNESFYLEEQIQFLKDEGCNLIFSELLSIDSEKKPEFHKALKALTKGDELVVTKLDRAFSSRNECIRVINKLLNQDIQLRTLSGFFTNKDSPNKSSLVFNILCELNNLDYECLKERKRENVLKRKLNGNNLGGRPKISTLKESLVIRLRKEGYSYRSIRAQTGIALSTIRRVILDGEGK